MSIYDPTWRLLKLKKTVTIKAAPFLHARIKKAVGKRKLIDSAYHVRMDGYRCTLHSHSDGNTLTINLVETLYDFKMEGAL